MARENDLVETATPVGGGGGRLNNKADQDDDENLLGRAMSMGRRTERIGKNSYCHRRRLCGRSMLQPVPFLSWGTSPQSKMILLPIYLGLLSQVGLFAGGVEGNGEIETCVVQTRSSSGTSAGVATAGGVPSSSMAAGVGGSNGLGYYSGSSSVQNNGAGGSSSGAGASGSSGGVGGSNNGLGGGGNINNNNEPATAALVDPHSVILCQIRTLHPDLDLKNLTSSVSSGGGEGGMGAMTTTVVDTSSITRLKLVCNDVLFFESVVSPGQLRSLSELHDLSIEKCKLTKLPDSFLSGLRHLRKLTINTGNSDWAARSLELEPDALSDVPQLRHLHLGYNHMWNLPGGVLCKLGSLQSLNMTHNLLNDIEDLGLPGRPVLGSINKNSGEYDQTSSSSSSASGDGSSISSAGGSGLSCLAELKSLDLSFNSLRTLGSHRMEQLKRLQDFRLEGNWLEELEDDALYGLGQLRLLNLSSNRLVALPTKLFQHSKLLRELDFRNNSLAALSPGLLNGLEHLQVLDLSMNSLSSSFITAEAFKGLVRLVILNLSHNQLTHLAPSTFHDLYTLQVLDLSNNLISSIADETFAPMSNLHSLNLAKNRLVTLNANMFNGLYVLHKLILDYNQISSIGSMKNLTSLQDLSLVGNNLQEVPQALRGLQLLRTLDLGDCKIKGPLTNESFLGMAQLIGLRLVDNTISEIPKGFCESMNKLRVLNMAQNNISKISVNAFHACPDLRVLRLDSNKLNEIPPTLAPQLPNLLWLNLSENSIKKADYTFLPTTLEWLDISHNELETLEGSWSGSSGGAHVPSTDGNTGSEGSSQGLIGSNGSKNNMLLPRSGMSVHSSHNNHHHQPFADHPNAKLRVVDASFNKLTTLDHQTIPPRLEVLRLNHNSLKRIAPNSFGRTYNLRRVELIGNNLENIPLTALRLPVVPQGKPLPEFFLGGNPFLCDCEMEWLTRINQMSTLRQHPTVLDLDAIVCRLAYSRGTTHIPLPDIKPQDFLCSYQNHCFALCGCCDFEFCDCAMTCPTNCTCFHDQAWSANVVNCGGGGLGTSLMLQGQHKSIPARLPMDSTEVFLDGNSIQILKSHAFIGRKNLRILYLNNSQIETISNKSFNGLASLQQLHLESNKLKTLAGFEFDHLSRLRELYLHDNLIETISNTTFLPLKSLEILRLDGNRLVVFTVWQLSLNPYLVEIGLARNQWNCDCHFLHQLYGWVTDNSRKVVDLVQLQCVWNTTHKPGPHLIDYNRTCGSSWALMGIENGFDFSTLSPLPLALAFVSLVTLLILVVALVIICRENLSLWLFTRFNGFRLCATADYEDDKSYDSYLIYSQKDEEFVAQRIADELETNDNYRLCLHYRDLICETGDLKEMMIGAVENSKSVLIILSRNFLQGEWSSGEYRSAFHAVLKKSQRGGGSGASKVPPKKILIVFIEDIPKVDINPEIRSWVRQNRIKVIKWNIHSTDYGKNRKFWNKLKFILPDASSHYHSNITSNTTTTSASSNEGHAGVMATLKYSTQGESHLHHHPISHSPHSNGQHLTHHHYSGHHPQQQIIVDESGRFTTTTIGSGGGGHQQIPSSQTSTLNSIKYWPYGATNFVALPPKYQSHHSSSAGSHPPSVNSPGSPLHYHPPLPLTNPPKSPPSSQSTDSTTTTIADDAPSLMSQLTMASFHSANNVSATKSPVPVPKSSYSSSPRNNIPNSLVNNHNNMMLSNPSNSSNNGSSSSTSSSASNNMVGGGSVGVSNGMGGESYLSIDGEHVYSTLDPPSPQPLQQTMSLMSQNILGNGIGINSGGANFLNNIHLPNGYTYQPQSTLNHPHSQPQQQPQWLSGASHHPQPQYHHQQSSNRGGGGAGADKHHHHHHQAVSNFVGSPSSGGPKSFKKEGNNPVQTYLV